VTDNATNRDWLAANQAVVDEFRANNGKVGGRFEGRDIVLLTTTGAKSGASRLSPLAYFVVEGRMLIVGSSHGVESHPARVHNLRADPRAHIEFGNEALVTLQSYDVVAHELSREEREMMFPKLTERAPEVADFQSKTQRDIAVFELKRA
jgi:deazaflavin-dependent oxidoreductase (nitroreductase family)